MCLFFFLLPIKCSYGQPQCECESVKLRQSRVHMCRVKVEEPYIEPRVSSQEAQVFAGSCSSFAFDEVYTRICVCVNVTSFQLYAYLDIFYTAFSTQKYCKGFKNVFRKEL